jgi:hypothetical protein
MVISGESMGGFYIIYVLLGLLHGVLHSLLGFYGILALVIGFHLSLKRNVYIKQVLCVMGVFLMAASVFFFFRKDTAHYNWGTFDQGLPMFTLVFTGIIAILFLIGIFWRPQQVSGLKPGVLSKV